MTKNCILNVACKSNAIRVKSFHIYKTGINYKSKLSFFFKSSVKELKPLRKKNLKKKKKIFCLLVRSKQWTLRGDGSQRKFYDNAVLIFKKKLNLLSNFFYGPTLIELKRKKILKYYNNIF